MENEYNLTPGKVFSVEPNISKNLFKAFHEPGTMSCAIMATAQLSPPGFVENLVKTGKLLGGADAITFLGFVDDSFEKGLFENSRGERAEVFLGPEIDPHLELVFNGQGRNSLTGSWECGRVHSCQRRF